MFRYDCVSPCLNISKVPATHHSVSLPERIFISLSAGKSVGDWALPGPLPPGLPHGIYPNPFHRLTYCLLLLWAILGFILIICPVSCDIIDIHTV